MSAMAILRATCKLVVLHSDEPTVLQDECNNLSVIMGIMLPFRNCAFPALQRYPLFNGCYGAMIQEFLANTQLFFIINFLLCLRFLC